MIFFALGSHNISVSTGSNDLARKIIPSKAIQRSFESGIFAILQSLGQFMWHLPPNLDIFSIDLKSLATVD